MVVLPTDTVYGISATPFDASAVERLFLAKGRTLQKGIPLLLSEIADLEKVVDGGWDGVPNYAKRLINEFWAGSLTLILPKVNLLPAIISPNAGIAVRVPNHSATRTLLKAVGGVLAVSSANQADKPPARTASYALQLFDGKVALVLDGGLSPQAIGSTIIDCMGTIPRLLRVGAIDSVLLEEVAGLKIAKPNKL